MKRWIKAHGAALSLLLVLSIMIMIFCFSAQPADLSSQTSGRFTEWLIKLLVPDFSAQDPVRQEEIRSLITVLVRKTAHVAEYAMLGLSLMLHMHELAKKKGLRKPGLTSLLIGVLYAASDEIHQIFVPGRSGEAKDVLLDSAGVLLGILLLIAVRMIGQKRQRV